jgi:hypothetical protein
MVTTTSHGFMDASRVIHVHNAAMIRRERPGLLCGAGLRRDLHCRRSLAGVARHSVASFRTAYACRGVPC